MPGRHVMEHIQQNEGVNTARNRHQEPLPRTNKRARADNVFYMFQQFTHARMLFPLS